MTFLSCECMLPDCRWCYPDPLKVNYTREAEARLIAAAPDLYEALRDVVALSDRKHNAWDRAHAAIAKVGTLTTRKLALLQIDPQRLIELCQGGPSRAVANILPADARVIGVGPGYNPNTNRLVIVLESESFADIREGDEIPTLPSVIFERGLA